MAYVSNPASRGGRDSSSKRPWLKPCKLEGREGRGREGQTVCRSPLTRILSAAVEHAWRKGGVGQPIRRLEVRMTLRVGKHVLKQER